jgi:4-hydroxy 2-oxovalerate aldolase
MNKLTILDCTLRDGGYYNDWDFTPELVQEYVKEICLAGIDKVELGLRNFSSRGFKGAFFYTTDEFIDTLGLPATTDFGVMVDAKTILSSELTINEAVSILFKDSQSSQISLVRIACHFSDVLKTYPIVSCLKNLGYQVGLNLMQISLQDQISVVKTVKEIESWVGLDVLYFADSLGNMTPDSVEEVVKSIKSVWTGDVGFHSHDNMGNALANSKRAAKLGVSWIDSTIQGMGRGAGNLATEILLADLPEDYSVHYDQGAVYRLSIDVFSKLKDSYRWGHNFAYHIGAKNNIHPTYIQSILTDPHFGEKDLVQIIERLSVLANSSSYDQSRLEKLTSSSTPNQQVETVALDLHHAFHGRKVLVIASGECLSRYEVGVKLFIEKHKPIVVSINIVEGLLKEYVDYVVTSHNSKFFSQEHKLSNLTAPIILPVARLLPNEIASLVGCNLINYNIEINPHNFSASEDGCIVNYDLTFAYLLGMFTYAQPSDLYLVGFDGYQKGDSRQIEVLSLIDQYADLCATVNLCALTPTSYPISMGSIYAPSV